MTEPTSWNDFFVAEAGASAALAGLVFVAVSINLTEILRFPHLPMRVVEALVTLLSVLVVSTFALAPGQGQAALGIEIAATGCIVWLVKNLALAGAIRVRWHKASGWQWTIRICLTELPSIPFIVCGCLLLAGAPSALYWSLAGALLSFTSGLIDVWILLIEIKR